MKKRKAQVTIFIILGIVLLLVVALSYLVQNNIIEGLVIKETFKNINNVDSSVKTAVKECLRITAEDALKLTALQGRVYPEDFFTYQNNKVYYAFNNQKSIITIEQLQNEISRYINENLKSCTEDIFEDFRKRGVVINEKNPETKTIIALKDVSIALNYPIEFGLAAGNEKRTISKFVENFNIRLKKLHEISEDIVNFFEFNPNNINLTYLNTQDIFSTAIPYPDGTTVFILEDSKSLLRQHSYGYSFAIK